MDIAQGLTKRERVILAHLALPLTLGEIAGSLFVTRNTVKSQVRSIYLKLGVADREAALRAGRRLGLLSADLGMPEIDHRPRRRFTGVPQPAIQTSTR
jgi:LuxR family transcriptional regulator of spore coat protein